VASELPISTILSIGDLSSVLSSVANQKNILFKGATLDPMLPRTIARVKRSIALRFAASPSDTTVRGTAEYLLQICGPFALQSQTILNNLSGSLPAITGPSNQSILVAQTATFSVSVAGTGPFTFQWFRNSVLVPGETSSSLSVPNAQLSDSGATFFVQVTNAAGTQTSGTATLTVTASLVGSLAYMDADPGPTLRGGSDPFTYQETFSITAGQPWVMAVPGASTPNKFIIIKGPIGQPIKTIWNNAGVNVGVIPDSQFQTTLIIGSQQYYYSRIAMTLDPLNTLTLS